jgi:N,N'-diacetyllegionaminate synthase
LTQIIAEIAQAHEGSLGIAHSYIDSLAKCGVDVIKFQTHIADAESSEFESFRVKFSYEDATRFDYWKRMEFTADQWAGLKKHCEDLSIEFMSSPFSIAAVELLEKLNVSRYKIGSGEISNYLMLQKIAQTGKPIILSSGMSDLEELDDCVNFLKQWPNQVGLMQCTTAYPTAPEQWGLEMISILKNRYQMPVGFSDHSANIYAGLAAAALGADFLEFHVVFNHQMFGPDAKASLNLEQVAELVKGVRSINQSLATSFNKNEIQKYQDLKILFGKSLTTKNAVRKGEKIFFDDLETAKPGNKGISAKDFQKVIGKTWANDLPVKHFVTENDFK